jgi:hypothetical protein
MFRSVRPRAALLAVAVASTTAGGCRNSVTEIVLVVDSELAVPDEIARVGVVLDGAAAGPEAGSEIDYDLTGQALPATLGLLPAGDGAQPFSVEVRGERADGGIVVRMAASGVRFVGGQNLMLVLPLRRACACAQPDCPISSAPGCETLAAPVLPPFSPDAVPPHATPDGGDGGGADGTSQ